LTLRKIRIDWLAKTSIETDSKAMLNRLKNTYSKLPDAFYSEALPTRVRAPEVVVFNHALAESLELELESQPESELANVFAGNVVPSSAVPIAQAYAGHQYGGFTMLGDGRAILLGEQRIAASKSNRISAVPIDAKLDEVLFDIQLKGPGPTPYSRRGDGRAALGPMLREYIISEAMFALGIPTTRSLAVVRTGEKVFREDALSGAVLTRIAYSHIRVGTFQYAAATHNRSHLQALADYTIHRHFPSLADSDNRYLDLLRVVIDRQASLVASWQYIGFVHGVMNTDNVAISGETIDYGPCAFMETYHPATVFSSIDAHGRYAYGNQPHICHWNLVRFAESLLTLLHETEETSIALATEAIEAFPKTFESYWLDGMRKKFGLLVEDESDQALIQELFDWMTDHQADYTTTLRDLSDGVAFDPQKYQSMSFTAWHAKWQQRVKRDSTRLEDVYSTMRRHNPSIIPRNQRVEESLEAAENGDLSKVTELVIALQNPFSDDVRFEKYRTPSSYHAGQYRTFCGT
jgi:serine/tyrosine/threonine adenylyltransferase